MCEASASVSEDVRDAAADTASVDLSSLSSAFEFPIVGHEVLERRSRYTVYRLHVRRRDGGQQWFLMRRYTDFLRVHERLRALFPALPLQLPPKRLVRDNFEPAFLERRQSALQLWVQQVTDSGPLSRAEPVRQFFCVDEPLSPRDSPEHTQLLCDALEQALRLQHNQLQESRAESQQLRRRLRQLQRRYVALAERLQLSGSLHQLQDSETSDTECRSMQSVSMDCLLTGTKHRRRLPHRLHSSSGQPNLLHEETD